MERPHSTFLQQVGALLQKCFLIKKKNRLETFTEFLIGIQYVVILIILKITITPQPGQNSQVYQSVDPNYIVNSMPLLGYVDLSSGGQATSLLQYTNFPKDKLVAFSNESYMVDTYLDNAEKYWGGVIFNGIDTSSNLINYTIRLNNTFSNIQSSPYPYIEQNILTAFLQLKKGLNISIGFTTTEFPVPTNPYFLTAFNFLFPIYFPLFFVYSLQQLIILLVTEKKDGIREGLKVMGMRESAYWTSNIIMQLIMNTLLIVVMEVMCFASKVFTYSSPVMIFIAFFLFAFTLIGIGFVVSSFITNPKSGSALSALILLLGIGLSCLYQFYLNTKVPNIKYLFYLFSPCAFGGFLVKLSFSEAQKIAIPWSDKDFTEPIGFMILDFILYSIISWYSIEVYGTGKDYFFFLDRNYWYQSNRPTYNKIINESSSYMNKEGSAGGIELNEIYKEFVSPTDKKKKIKAVNGLTLNIREGTIFALLGHNSAGKSTTLGMLTGMISPTSGNAYINGLNVKTQMDFIRRHIGFCPQHNILYNQLSCAEHLRLFGKIKGVPSDQLETTIDTALQEVGLTEKKDTLSSALSGGMKRRLSLAMAFIGDPTIVFLDECTTGLDPMARHQVWQLLQNKKHGKTIIMTTHFMEEAELLGESIGILSKGKLRCMGTALELKALFGLGYILSFTFDRHQLESVKHFEDYFFSRFKDAVPGKQNASSMERDQGDIELSFSLSHQKSENLSDFFEEIESKQFSIKRTGISMTTLEEVFLKIQNEFSEDDESNHN